jgi:hypothetical protein
MPPKMWQVARRALLQGVLQAAPPEMPPKMWQVARRALLQGALQAAPPGMPPKMWQVARRALLQGVLQAAPPAVLQVAQLAVPLEMPRKVLREARPEAQPEIPPSSKLLQTEFCIGKPPALSRRFAFVRRLSMLVEYKRCREGLACILEFCSCYWCCCLCRCRFQPAPMKALSECLMS